MAQDYTSIHLLAGGLGGTAGAVITCPLEVVKTRLQSSLNTFATASPALVQHKMAYIPSTVSSATFSTCTSTCTTTVTSSQPVTTPRTSVSLTMCLKHIIKNEGAQGLFKGLGPNLIGVAPSRAVYFFSYAQAKKHLNKVLPEETPIVHVCSAACAGFTASTLTNPIWFVKTRLQLDLKRNSKLTARDCIRQIYQKHGIQGFYKGITASYYGITETAIHFVIYEAIKAYLREMKGQEMYEEDRSVMDFVQFMMAGATSKTIATCVAYPHEVARTRLRQEGTRYNTFWQTLRLVFKEEGPRGLYRGLCTQLVRQIPNTAIMMSTYEAVVYLCMKYWHLS